MLSQGVAVPGRRSLLYWRHRACDRNYPLLTEQVISLLPLTPFTIHVAGKACVVLFCPSCIRQFDKGSAEAVAHGAGTVLLHTVGHFAACTWPDAVQRCEL